MIGVSIGTKGKRRGKIKLSITKIKVDILADGVGVSFNQRYQSGSTRLFTRKNASKKRRTKLEDCFEG